MLKNGESRGAPAPLSGVWGCTPDSILNLVEGVGKLSLLFQQPVRVEVEGRLTGGVADELGPIGAEGGADEVGNAGNHHYDGEGPHHLGHGEAVLAGEEAVEMRPDSIRVHADEIDVGRARCVAFAASTRHLLAARWAHLRC